MQVAEFKHISIVYHNLECLQKNQVSKTIPNSDDSAVKLARSMFWRAA